MLICVIKHLAARKEGGFPGFTMWDSFPSQHTPHSLRGAAWITSSVPAVPQHPSRGLRVGVARRGSQKHTLPSWGGVTCLWDSPPPFLQHAQEGGG